MKKKIIFIILSLLIILGIYGHHLLKKSLPPMAGEIQLHQLKKPVKVYRDKWGVPHIYAENQKDLHLALGYIMAGDRLFQMDILRRIARGQLAEVLGEKALPLDILLRKLRLYRFMEDFWQKNQARLSAEMLEYYNDYLKGVHLYMNNNPLPLEFHLLGYRPKEFEIVELMAISGYLALSFAEGIIGDVLFTELYQEFPKEMVDELLIRVGNDQNVITQTFVSYDRASWIHHMSDLIATFSQPLAFFHGSNSWVLAADKTQNGRSILASDPHIAFSQPGVWYEAHLVAPNYEIYGHFIPGVPFPGLGHNSTKAWGITMSEIDDLDLYVETLDPQKKHYLFEKQWLPLKIENEIIHIKNKEALKLKVLSTQNGPLIDDTEYGLKDQHLAIKWSYHHPENNIISAIYQLSRARNVTEMRAATSLAAAPGFNILWADHENNIAWQVMGKIPLRAKDTSGKTLLDGTKASHQYTGYLNFTDHPMQINPRKGYITSTNYYPETSLVLDGYWQPAERYERLEEVLSQKKKFSAEDMKQLQLDHFVGFAPRALQILLPAISSLQAPEAQILKDWDYQCHQQSVACSIFHVWQRKLMQNTLMDQLGEKRYQSFARIADFWHAWKTILQTPSSGWWDDISTDQKESREDIIRKSFKDSLHFLQKRLGDDSNQWQWGKLNQVVFTHPLGRQPPLDKIFNIGPLATAGGFNQINNMSSPRGSMDFKVLLGPSTRRVIDFARIDTSWGILPTGNSGHILSPFYNDQSQIFTNEGHRKQFLEKKEIEENSNYLLILK